jgi:hypothetical protein
MSTNKIDPTPITKDNQSYKIELDQIIIKMTIHNKSQLHSFKYCILTTQNQNT